jgi:uridine monophosphate synthetase
MAEFQHLEDLVVGLYDRDELGFANSPEEFIRLKSDRLSPTFFNGRRIMAFSDTLSMSIENQARLAELTVEGYVYGLDQTKNGYDHIINLPQAVNPIIGAVALVSGDSSLYLRTPEGEKGYGKHQPIEGVFKPGDAVVGIDNVVSNGDTKKEVTVPIEDSGLKIREFVVLLDRQEGGEAALKADGYDLTSVITMGAATQILRDARRITADQARWSFEYIARYNVPV